MYDYIKQNEINKIVKGLNWYFQNTPGDNSENDGMDQVIAGCYTGIQTFGCTDYVDHRSDTPSELKKFILKYLAEKYCTQRGHFYDSEGQIVKNIIVSGYHGGVVARFIYDSGKTAFNRVANEPIKHLQEVN